MTTLFIINSPVFAEETNTTHLSDTPTEPITDTTPEHISTQTTTQPIKDTNYNREIDLDITPEHQEALENHTPIIDVKSKSGKKINDYTLKKTNTTNYKIQFTDDEEEYDLNVTVLGHKSEIINIKTLLDPNTTLYTAKQSLSPIAYNLLIISGSSTYAKPTLDSNIALRNEGYYHNLRFFTPEDITSAQDEKLESIKEYINKADTIILEMIGVSSADTLYNLVKNATVPKIALRCSSTFNLSTYSDIDITDTLRTYWDGSGSENMARFQLKVLNDVGMYVDPNRTITSTSYPDVFMYHPDSPIASFTNFDEYIDWYKTKGYSADKPTIGILMYQSHFNNGNGDMPISLLRSLEEKGMNVLLVVAKSSNPARQEAVEKFFTSNGKTIINALIMCMGYNVVLNKPVESAALFDNLGIPVFAPIYASNLATWEESTTGAANEVYWQVAQPEMEGRIEPILMGGVKNTDEIDEYTQISIKRYTPLEDRIDRVTQRVVNWVKLQYLENAAKKVGIIYYNIAGGKDGVTASYLNVEKSISNVLVALKEAGYDVEGDTNIESLVELFVTAGNNVGSWAPGEVEKLVEAGAIQIPLEQYKQWFSKLPSELQNEVIAKWGDIPGNVMVYNNNIIIPGRMFGNIFVGAQPMRGWGEDPESITHSTTLPPTHQYIAFYMWLQENMDAIIHMGTHGTLEWLPGKAVGLSGTDWPDVLLGNLVDIYPYIMDNTGEGTQAKRRGNALIIDHLTATFIESGLYGNLSELNDKISQYKLTTEDNRKTALKVEIIELIKVLDLQTSLELDLNGDFDAILNRVENHLMDITSALIPYGLHSFGDALSGDELEQMINSIVSFDPENRDNAEYRNDLREKLSSNYEMQNLLNALRGIFINPLLGGDPVRKGSEILSTGYNFYSFDPRTVPDKAAYAVGSLLAEDLIKNYQAEHDGQYPETVGVVLWSTETMRTMGQSIGMVFRLMGLEPVWDSSGRLKSYTVINSTALGRPRVDVLMSISGLFRDTFSYVIELLDDAARAVAKLNETADENYVSKHYQSDLTNYTNQGYDSKTSEFLAGSRIFGDAPQTYGTGLSALIPSTTGWNDTSDLVDTYMNKMSYIYARGNFGEQSIDALTNTLRNVDATIQVRDNNYGLYDNDDVFQFLGGLTAAARSVSGEDVQAYIGNTRKPTPEVVSLKEFNDMEISSRINNPKWVSGLLDEGFSGANTITKHVEHMFGMDALLGDTISDSQWNSVAKTILNNKDAYTKANSYAYAGALGYFIEASRRGMWNGPTELVQQIANEYVNTIADYGVVCCHHTCANIQFNKLVAALATVSPDQLSKYVKAVEAATGQNLGITVPTNSSSSNQNVESVKAVKSTSSSKTTAKKASKSSKSSEGKTSSEGSVGTKAQPNAKQSQSSSNKAQSSPSSQSSSNNVQSDSANADSSKSDDSQAQDDTANEKTDEKGDSSASKSYEVYTPQGSSNETGVSAIAIAGIIAILALFGIGYYRRKS